MSKWKTYQNQLKKLNPRKAVEQSRQYFSEKDTMEKLRTYSGRIGEKFVYYSLLLYYALQSPETPRKAKLTIAGALGYLILPADALPDFLPVVGFTDDSAVILYAVYQVISHIDEKVKEEAKVRMVKLFGDKVNIENLEDPTKSGKAD
ncbi:YkvA family protein [Halobacillus litoralis]|uniref:YkvA family protein n=1 Tax=Halobacillus litoralis TaxID=45668 RepID=UPI001CFD65DA|nr:YkvA family protein [Halobacillus litoralis]